METPFGSLVFSAAVVHQISSSAEFGRGLHVPFQPHSPCRIALSADDYSRNGSLDSETASTPSAAGLDVADELTGHHIKPIDGVDLLPVQAECPIVGFFGNVGAVLTKDGPRGCVTLIRFAIGLTATSDGMTATTESPDGHRRRIHDQR